MSAARKRLAFGVLAGAPASGATKILFDSEIDAMGAGLPVTLTLRMRTSADSAAAGVYIKHKANAAGTYRTDGAQAQAVAAATTDLPFVVLTFKPSGGLFQVVYVNSAAVLTAFEWELFADY